MSPLDYGPVPVSRLKEESDRIFEALDGGRRVLISRHGNVVAAIDPPSVEKHGRELALFAVRSDAEGLPELTAAGIGQGSPSEFIRKAEEGTPSWVTRNGKVHGVLRPASSHDTMAAVDAREEALARFEREHPDATAEEFAAAVAQWAPRRGVEAWDAENSPPRTSLGSPRTRQSATSGTADAVMRTLVDALHATGVAWETAGRPTDAIRAFRELIARFETHSDELVHQWVTQTMVELANIYNEQGNPSEALALLRKAMPRLDPTSTSVTQVMEVDLSETTDPQAESKASEVEEAQHGAWHSHA